MRLILTSAAALAAGLPALARAAEAPPPSAAPAVEAVVVTATRLPTRIDLVTGAHVIDAAELDARQTPFVVDVLATIPGVSVAQTGAFGGTAAIRIRGASPDKTLVLIDGVPAGDPSDPNGTFDASQLQSADLARIEVLSGPQGSLWGSDAIGGVVAFTTREPQGLSATAEGGAFGTARGALAAGTAQDAYALSASIAGVRTDGISKAAAGTEKDPFATVTADLGGRVKLGQAAQLDARLRYTTSDIAIDGFAPPAFLLGDTPDRYASHAWQGFARATFDALGFTQKLSFSDYQIHRRNITSFPSAYRGDRRVWRWTAERGGADDATAVVVGAERADAGANLSGRPSLDLSTTSAFAVLRHDVTGALTLTGSVRYDDPDRFASRTTGRLSAATHLDHGISLTISAGQGFKTPTISETVCDFCFAPPVALRPERAEGYDARLAWRSDDDRLSAAITGYRLNVRDQIAYVASRYVNVARTRSTGAEAEAEAQLTAALRLKLAYAYTHAIDAATGRALPRAPERTGSAALFWDQGPWQATLTARAESSQADTALDGFSRTTRKGFATADLAGAYRVNAHVTLTARVENLADERYQEVFGYGEPGRAAYVGVRLRD
jgi:vitamin B12 transporter